METRRLTRECRQCGKDFVLPRPDANSMKFCSDRCRFESKVVRGAADDCWLWTAAARHRFGYGAMQIDRGAKVATSHRLAWTFANGPIPDGMSVLHRCDNPPCCNPAHLFLGTNADNMADMAAKGRSGMLGKRHPPEVRALIAERRNASNRNLTHEGRRALSEASKRLWQNVAFRERFSVRMTGANNPNIAHMVANNGEVLPLTEWARRLSMPYKALLSRYSNGERGERLFRPIRPMRNIKYEFRGTIKPLHEWASQFGLLSKTVYARYDSGDRGDALFRERDHLPTRTRRAQIPKSHARDD